MPKVTINKLTMITKKAVDEASTETFDMLYQSLDSNRLEIREKNLCYTFYLMSQEQEIVGVSNCII